jgi:hypothetical protein
VPTYTESLRRPPNSDRRRPPTISFTGTSRSSQSVGMQHPVAVAPRQLPIDQLMSALHRVVHWYTSCRVQPEGAASGGIGASFRSEGKQSGHRTSRHRPFGNTVASDGWGYGKTPASAVSSPVLRGQPHQVVAVAGKLGRETARGRRSSAATHRPRCCRMQRGCGRIHQPVHRHRGTLPPEKLFYGPAPPAGSRPLRSEFPSPCSSLRGRAHVVTDPRITRPQDREGRVSLL